MCLASGASAYTCLYKCVEYVVYVLVSITVKVTVNDAAIWYLLFGNCVNLMKNDVFDVDLGKLIDDHEFMRS